MPANLTPEYRAAEARFRAAVTPEEKLLALEEMLRAIPKHKGTEKLQADIKSRIARQRRAPRKKPGGKGPIHHISREGAGQVALVGPPNAGKSALVDRLTHAKPEVASYPMSTREATPGMMPFEDVAIQLIDLPPICAEHVEPWVWDAVRTADLVWLVVDAEQSLEGVDSVEELLAGKAIRLRPLGSGEEAKQRPGWSIQPAFLVATGLDRPGVSEDLELLPRLLDRGWPIQGVSAVSGEGLDALARRTFEALGVIRVYSKEPGKPPDRSKPFTLPRGSTVGDLARTIHKEIAEDLKFARVWGTAVHDGQRVHARHLLEEGDVVELHA